MRVKAAPFLLASALALSSVHAQDRTPAVYREIVDQFRTRPNDATERLLAMPGADVDRAIHEAVRRDSGWTPQDFDAAMLMHTDAGIVADFRSRYLLSYAPKGVDAAGWHPIEVKVKGRRATVTARRGYQR